LTPSGRQRAVLRTELLRRLSFLGDLTHGPVGYNTASFKGNTTEANLELGRRIWCGPWSMRPVGAVDILMNHLDAATETGPNAVAYGKASLTQVFLRTGTDLRYQRNRFTFNSGLYYAYNVNDDTLESTMAVAGNPGQLTGTKLGDSLLTFIGLREYFEPGLSTVLSRSPDYCDCATLRLNSRGPIFM